MDSMKIMSECIRKVKALEREDIEKRQSKLLQEVDSLLTPPSTDPDSPVSDAHNKDFGDFIDESPEEQRATPSPSSASSVSSSSSSSNGCITRSMFSELLVDKQQSTITSFGAASAVISSRLGKHVIDGAKTVEIQKTTTLVKVELASGSYASSVRSSSVCSAAEEESLQANIGERLSTSPPLPTFVCKWINCDWPGVCDDLVDHIREIHVELQPYAYTEQQQISTCSFRNVLQNGVNATASSSSSGKSGHSYVCLWQGCKVYGKGSLCKSWLENHVLQHSGPRPFKCIFDRCNQRFKTRALLEKHVNTHFAGCGSCDFCRLVGDRTRGSLPVAGHEQLQLTGCTGLPNSQTNGNCTNKKMNGLASLLTPVKQAKKKKQAKFRRRPYARSTEDLFDDCALQQLRNNMSRFHSLTGLERSSDFRSITLRSRIIGRCREEKTGTVKLLLRWDPENILEDAWVAETEAGKMLVKHVPLNQLPLEVLSRVSKLLRPEENRTKQRRK